MEFNCPRLQRHNKEAIYFLPLSSQEFLVLILSTSEGWKAELALESPSGFEHRTLGLQSSTSKGGYMYKENVWFFRWIIVKTLMCSYRGCQEVYKIISIHFSLSAFLLDFPDASLKLWRKLIIHRSRALHQTYDYQIKVSPTSKRVPTLVSWKFNHFIKFNFQS